MHSVLAAVLPSFAACRFTPVFQVIFSAHGDVVLQYVCVSLAHSRHGKSPLTNLVCVPMSLRHRLASGASEKLQLASLIGTFQVIRDMAGQQQDQA